MKDLFVLTADADMQAVLKTILARHQALGIRKISFLVDRHPMRDSGMVKDGPELARMQVQKDQYARLVLIWDHEGSGHQGEASSAVAEITKRLDRASWIGRSGGIAIAPELEEWIWHNPESVAKQLGLPRDRLDAEFARRDAAAGPKELLEYLFLRTLRRRPLPRDFEEIASVASVRQWMASESFGALVAMLRSWFPR